MLCLYLPLVYRTDMTKKRLNNKRMTECDDQRKNLRHQGDGLERYEQWEVTDSRK